MFDFDIMTEMDRFIQVELHNLKGLHLSIVQDGHLKKQHQKINKIDKTYGFSPLYLAVGLQRVSMTRALAKMEQIEINLGLPSQKRTPLHLAVMLQNLEITKILVDNGANVNMVDSTGCSAIHYSLLAPTSDLFNFLYFSGASIDIIDSSGKTLVHHAAKLGNSNVLKLLLKKSMDPNALNTRQKTPLYYAIKKDEIEITKMLLDSGADISKCNLGSLNLSIEMQHLLESNQPSHFRDESEQTIVAVANSCTNTDDFELENLKAENQKLLAELSAKEENSATFKRLELEIEQLNQLLLLKNKEISHLQQNYNQIEALARKDEQIKLLEALLLAKSSTTLQ